MQTLLLRTKYQEAIAKVKGDAFRIVEHSKAQTAGTRHFTESRQNKCWGSSTGNFYLPKTKTIVANTISSNTVTKSS